jgi:hypothetical protein
MCARASEKGGTARRGVPASFKTGLSARQLDVKLARMKFFVRAFVVFAVTVFCFSGCGKKTAPPEKSAASYPLPEPQLVADCEPGNLGGRFIVSQDIQLPHGE